MTINYVRVLLLVSLVSCGAHARISEKRGPHERAGDNKYAGSMLAEIAKELVQRSATSSQVLI